MPPPAPAVFMERGGRARGSPLRREKDDTEQKKTPGHRAPGASLTWLSSGYSAYLLPADDPPDPVCAMPGFSSSSATAPAS